MQFNEYLKHKRKSLGYGLRDFSRQKGYDPSYVSRLENGLISPPEDKDKLEGLAVALELEEGTPEWVTFFDLAAAANYTVPNDIQRDFPNIVNVLPAFYRSVRKEELDSSTIQDLVALLKSED